MATTATTQTVTSREEWMGITADALAKAIPNARRRTL